MTARSLAQVDTPLLGSSLLGLENRQTANSIPGKPPPSREAAAAPEECSSFHPYLRTPTAPTASRSHDTPSWQPSSSREAAENAACGENPAGSESPGGRDA